MAHLMKIHNSKKIQRMQANMAHHFAAAKAAPCLLHSLICDVEAVEKGVDNFFTQIFV